LTEDRTIQSFAIDHPDAEGPTDDPFAAIGSERRRTLRIPEKFPATVRGKDADGEEFEIRTVVENIGNGGLYVRLARSIKPGLDLSVVVRLSAAEGGSVFAPKMAIHGEVLRAEPQPDGSYGVAVEFHERRFL
jgi:hypothetical protein